MKFLLLFVFLPLAHLTYGQNVVVCPTKMNVLYTNIENPVTVMVNDKRCNEYSIRMKDAEIMAVGNCHYTIRPLNNVERFAYVYVLNGLKKAIDSIEFRIKRIPDPVTDKRTPNTFQLKPSEIASLYEVLDTSKFEFRFEVLGFDVSLLRQNIVVDSFTDINTVFFNPRMRTLVVDRVADNNTASFNLQVRKLLRKARRGDGVWFENISVKGPDGHLRQLGSLLFLCP